MLLAAKLEHAILVFQDMVLKIPFALRVPQVNILMALVLVKVIKFGFNEEKLNFQ